MVDYEVFRSRCASDRLSGMIPCEVVDGLIVEIYLEANDGLIPCSDGHLFVTMVRRYCDRVKNYLAGKMVSCKMTGEWYKRVPKVSEEVIDVVEVYDDSFETFGEEVNDDFPSVDALALAISELKPAQSKLFNRLYKECLGSCLPEVQLAFFTANARALKMREDRRKMRKH